MVLPLPIGETGLWAGLHRVGSRWVAVWALVFAAGGGWQVRAADVAEVEAKLRRGDYAAVIDQATAGFGDTKDSDENWPRLLVDALSTVGRSVDAANVASNAIVRYPRSLRLRWVASGAYRDIGDAAKADGYVEEIRRLISSGAAFARDPATIVVVGKVALRSGSDPKDVLNRIFQIAEKADPKLRDTYLARGELALEKSDFELAAKAYSAGLEHHPEDADLLCGLAQSLLGSDRPRAMEALEAALKANPHHLPSFLILADHSIDAEDYPQAEKLLAEVEKVNPHHPDVWSYRAVLAHLRHDGAAEDKARATGLAVWTNNPAVDHLIGRKLSQKYRFTEGAEHQRSALKMDPTHLGAQLQLAGDLLRLGDEEGWTLAQEAYRRDAYGTAAYNLVTLFDTMARFATLTNSHFIIRMNRREAEVFGPRVVALLERAHERLVGKYGATLQEPTRVEIFDNQKDFGVRTFGMPDNPGYLGVCFGRVITANSPAANKSAPVNWEAVLWHEFCHVVTLQLTANRMPRWLSEGISVYEELQENGSWGQAMTPRYRSMIVGGELTPLGKLSGAFLAPKTQLHLQFAYFEAALVVEFLVQDFGLPALQGVLRDLRDGTAINDAFAARMKPMTQLEPRFEAFARARALGLAPGLAWDKPATNSHVQAILKLANLTGENPTNYYALHERARTLIQEKKWGEAREPLTTLTRFFPMERGPDSSWARLAEVHRGLGDTNAEIQALTKWTEIDDEAQAGYQRLMELSVERGDWVTVRRNAERCLAINPLLGAPYQQLARAQIALNQPAAAIGSLETVLKLDPGDPADTHFQLAQLLAPTNQPAARRHVLQALEEAPRHREALRLLSRLQTSVQPKPVQEVK